MLRQMPGTESSTMVVALTKHIKAAGPDGGVNTSFSVRGFDSLSGRLKEKKGRKEAMGFYSWIKDKYKGREESGNGDRSDADADAGVSDFLKGKHLEQLSFDEYAVLIDSYCDRTEELGMLGDAISLNIKLSLGEKEELWDRIEREINRER